MLHSVATGPTLADQIVAEVVRVLSEAEESAQPLEVDPARSRLFELFVAAEGAGYLEEGGARDLTADGLCHILAEHWGLRAAAMESTAKQTRLAPDQLARMRQLWSVMRMWMEWTYAWSRWAEFHREASAK